MDDKKKFVFISKKIIKDSILKYSNISLFERREKNYRSEKKDKEKTPKLIRITKYSDKKIREAKENILYPFCQTMSSFHSLDKTSSVLPLLDFFENDNTKNNFHKHKYNKIIANHKTEIKNFSNIRDKINKTINHFYITDTSAIKSENKHKIKNISFLLNKEKNKKNDLSMDTLLLIKNKRNNDNNELKRSGYLPFKNKLKKKYYSLIQTDLNKNNFDKTIEEQEAKPIMSLKTIKFNDYKPYKCKDFIKKTNDLKLQSYTIKTKKERVIRLEESYCNKLELYQDTINSLKSAQKLLDTEFSNKITDYTRFVVSKKEREKVKCSKLIQEILNHRKEIEHIKNRISKIEIEKNNILKWIYFMIKMKEKKLILPSNYKSILERPKEKRLTRRDTIRIDKNKNKIQRKNSLFRAENNFPYNHKESTKDLKEKIKVKNNNNEKNIDNTRKEEYERILMYKTFLIFQTPEEFQERLSSFEKDNIRLIKYYNELYHQIFGYKNELELLKKDENKMEVKNIIINEKEKELNNIKNIVEEKVKLISKFMKRSENTETKYIEEKIKTKVSKNISKKIRSKYFIISEENKIKDNKDNLLFRKIKVIFEICKIFGSKLAFADYIINLLKKRIYSKEKEMILMLEFIEQTANYLITNFNYYLSQSDEVQNVIKNINFEIEKEHKIEKSRMKMISDLQKINLLKEKVEKRRNKIYFLPTKKISMNRFNIKKERKTLDKNVEKGEITIADFLYNEKNFDNK